MLKEQKGITLVALIITIIVMLILAGVSISLVVGENGVLTQAEDSKMAVVEGALRDAIGMASGEIVAAYYGTSADKAKAVDPDQIATFIEGNFKAYEGQFEIVANPTAGKITATPKAGGAYAGEEPIVIEADFSQIPASTGYWVIKLK